MILQGEIKDFIKNTLILTLFFTFVLHISWGYVGPMFGIETNAEKSNSKQFSETTLSYLGNTATALSLSIWQKEKQMTGAPIWLSNSIISIASVLSNPREWQRRLIWGNMSYIASYQHLLLTDIVGLLDRSTDRSEALDEHIALLESYGQDTTEKILSLDEQISELSTIIGENTSKANQAKAQIDASYQGLDYEWIDEAIESYSVAANADTKARIYKSYLENFRKNYLALQTKNKKLLETLKTNREALIKRSTVVIPTSGTDLLKELKLIQSEKEYLQNQN